MSAIPTTCRPIPSAAATRPWPTPMKRIQALNYVGCLHDNVQDMYRDAKSWNPDFIEKKADGSLIAGGRWLGGRAYMVCAPKQLELAQRTQNLPAIHDLFSPWAYFIDTTYAVPPRECHDPKHPIGRNDDIAWKTRLSDYGRNLFGIFGSECGREWALPHSDFFEGLVGVSGHYYHQLKPEELGAQVIPFFEMVYHDCQVCYGKYGYRAEEAAEYVAHHVLCARPLHYHSFPDHLYWQSMPERKADPSADRACYTRSDNGWAEGLHPYDVFIKNTHEVLGAINEVTGYNRLTEFRYLSDNGAVRQAVYGDRRRGHESHRQLRPNACRGHLANRRPHRTAPLGLPRRRPASDRLLRHALERPGLPQRRPVHPASRRTPRPL